MIKVSVAHKVAVTRLKLVGYATDFTDGSVLVSWGDARRVLGVSCHISRVLQVSFLKELVDLGLVVVVNKKNIKVL